MRTKAMLWLGYAAVALAGCASQPPAPPDGGRPLPESANEVVLTALALVGTPYALGGASPEAGFDCSGLVAYVYARASQLALPRSTFDLAHAGRSISAGALRPGDLVFFNTLRRPNSHVGIYLGDSRFVHAPTSGGQVRIEDMRVNYWTGRFDGARRVLF